MSGSFMPFCIAVFVITSIVLANYRLEHETDVILKFTQALALIGAVSEPLIEFFDGSVVNGLITAFLTGIIYLFFTTLHRRSRNQ